MNRRKFFAMIAAAVAAPKAWLLRRPKVVDDSKNFVGSVGILNTFEVELEDDLEHNRTCKRSHCSKRSHLLDIITN